MGTHISILEAILVSGVSLIGYILIEALLEKPKSK
jgi:hypothetical protein